jgi:heme exporter protein D
MDYAVFVYASFALALVGLIAIAGHAILRLKAAKAALALAEADMARAETLARERAPKTAAKAP